MKKSSFLYAIISLVAILFLAACGQQTTGTSQSAQSSSSFEAKTIEHDFGTTELTEEPKKIVILNNLYGEILMPLGMTPVGATTAQAGSEEFSTLFKEAFEEAEVVSVGWQKTPDLEAIAELEPDLILMTVHQEELYDKLSQIAPTIGYQINTEENWDFRETALNVAAIFDKEDEMQAIIDNLDKEQEEFAEAITETFGDKKLMYVRVTEKDIRYYGYGRFGYLYENYGFNRAEDFPAENMYEIIDTEKLMELDPDLLIVQADSEELLETKLKESEIWSNLTAVKNNQVIYADYSTYMLGFGVVSQEAVMAQIQSEWLN